MYGYGCYPACNCTAPLPGGCVAPLSLETFALCRSSLRKKGLIIIFIFLFFLFFKGKKFLWPPLKFRTTFQGYEIRYEFGGVFSPPLKCHQASR
jgi:hypothetical protein